MNSTQISQNVHDVVKSINKETFFLRFQIVFWRSQSNYQETSGRWIKSLSKNAGEIIWKEKVFYKVSDAIDLHF
jgi:hypothetical protein